VQGSGAGAGEERERWAAKFEGVVRGFSLSGRDDSAAVEGLPGSQEVPNLSVRSHAVEMKKGYGAFGGVARLWRSLNLTCRSPPLGLSRR
jgi:hypothetical protein